MATLLAVRTAELRLLEHVNIALSLAFVSSSLVVSTATMLTLIAYTSYGNDLSSEQVSDFFSATLRLRENSIGSPALRSRMHVKMKNMRFLPAESIAHTNYQLVQPIGFRELNVSVCWIF